MLPDFTAISRIDAMADAICFSCTENTGRPSSDPKILQNHNFHPEIFYFELVFRLIRRMGYFGDITKEGARIYTGMMTDTGGLL